MMVAKENDVESTKDMPNLMRYKPVFLYDVGTVYDEEISRPRRIPKRTWRRNRWKKK